MNESSTQKPRRLSARLATAMLAASLLLPSIPGAFPGLAHAPLRHEPVEVEHSLGQSQLPGPLVFYRGETPKQPYLVVADVAVDEEFVGRVGDEWRAEVNRMVEEANLLLSQIGLAISVASIQRWRSKDTWTRISDHLDSAEEQVGRAPGRLLIVITCQDTVKYDGWAQKSSGRMIMQFSHGNQRRNSALIAHEVGHLLGAIHHENEEECTEDGCVMDSSGYAHASTWCKHHRQQIQKEMDAMLALQTS